MQHSAPTEKTMIDTDLQPLGAELAGYPFAHAEALPSASIVSCVQRAS